MTDADELRRLDALVAERVMGDDLRVLPEHEWGEVNDDTCPFEQCRRCFETRGHCHGDGEPECRPYISHYAREPIHCATVKKRLREAGLCFRVEFGTFQVSVEKWKSSAEPSVATVYGDTEEEAVARFALACADRGLLEVKP
jgi:hypothetical protein